MPAVIPKNNLHKKEALDDNARKFIVKTIDSEFLDEHFASSFSMIVDWLETGEDDEKKVVYKRSDNGDVQILFISKITRDKNRTSIKESITEEKYKKLVISSVLHLKKRRYEFEYTQSSVPFSVKYDVFAKNKLCIMEVDAASEEERDSFDPSDFPSELSEVTGDIKYYGYRVSLFVTINHKKGIK